MNVLWFALLAVAFLFAAFAGKVGDFDSALFKQAQVAFEVALSLVGVMVFWLGIMKIAEKSGLVSLIAKAVHPVLRLVFPGVPRDHPALSAIALNVAANALGLDNAATPMGIKAMEELDKLNPKKGTLSDAQATLVAMNTAAISLLPVGIINLRLAAKSGDPYSVVAPTLLATGAAFTTAIVVAKALARLPRFRRQYEEAPDKEAASPEAGAAPSAEAGDAAGPAPKGAA